MAEGHSKISHHLESILERYLCNVYLGGDWNFLSLFYFSLQPIKIHSLLINKHCVFLFFLTGLISTLEYSVKPRSLVSRLIIIIKSLTCDHHSSAIFLQQRVALSVLIYAAGNLIRPYLQPSKIGVVIVFFKAYAAKFWTHLFSTQHRSKEI